MKDYITHRPGYPDAAIDYICNYAEIESGMCVADFGSGTGISSKYFVDRGYRVYGKEPNILMRKASVDYIPND